MSDGGIAPYHAFLFISTYLPLKHINGNLHKPSTTTIYLYIFIWPLNEASSIDPNIIHTHTRTMSDILAEVLAEILQNI